MEKFLRKEYAKSMTVESKPSFFKRVIRGAREHPIGALGLSILTVSLLHMGIIALHANSEAEKTLSSMHIQRGDPQYESMRAQVLSDVYVTHYPNEVRGEVLGEVAGVALVFVEVGLTSLRDRQRLVARL